MRIIDLSVPLESGIASDPPGFEPKITYLDHHTTAGQVTGFFPGMEAKDLPGGEGWAIEKLELITHNGTHLDAPYHHHSTMNGGERAITIDEVPLEWCFPARREAGFPGTCRRLCRHAGGYRKPSSPASGTRRNRSRSSSSTRRRARPTVAPDYIDRGCGMGRDATLWLLERGVRGHRHGRLELGRAVLAYAQTLARDARPLHRLGGASCQHGYRLLPYREADQISTSSPIPVFRISCFPFKIRAASAGFVRAVAILDA